MRLLSLRSRAGADPVRPHPRAAAPRGIDQHSDLGDTLFRARTVHARLGGMGPARGVDLRPGRSVVSRHRHVADVRSQSAHGAEISGALSNLTPLFAVVVAAFLLNEVPRPLQALGIAMVVIGVIGTRWH